MTRFIAAEARELRHRVGARAVAPVLAMVALASLWGSAPAHGSAVTVPAFPGLPNPADTIAGGTPDSLRSRCELVVAMPVAGPVVVPVPMPIADVQRWGRPVPMPDACAPRDHAGVIDRPAPEDSGRGAADPRAPRRPPG